MEQSSDAFAKCSALLSENVQIRLGFGGYWTQGRADVIRTLPAVLIFTK